MVFHAILSELVSTTPGAVGALFLDWEGETVEMRSDRPLDAADHDLKVLGAYQGIFLTRLRELCARVDAGLPIRFKVEFAEGKVLSCDLKEGYYLVLMIDSTGNEGLAWHRLEGCRQRLMGEI